MTTLELPPWTGQVSAARLGASSPRLIARTHPHLRGQTCLETAPGYPHPVSWLLQPETTRSLGAWLCAVAGDMPAPPDPDRVRAAIDEQRLALRQRSAHRDTTEEARTELAWASRALDAIAAACASTTREDT